MSAPRISVLIPCFNLGAYLEETVASVERQSRRDFELLIVDDGSTDPGTLNVLDSLAARGLTVVTTPNRGLAAARNTALARAQGEYVCALDADDLLEPTFLEKTSARLDTDSTLTFVSTWLRSFGAEEGVWKQSRCDLPMLLAEDTVLTASLVRRAAVVEVGGFDGGMGAMGYEDWDLWLSLVERGHRGAIIEEPLFLYRRRHGSMFSQCTRDDTHLGLVGYLHQKHAASYRTNALEVMALKEAEGARLVAATEALERELALILEPQVQGLVDELSRMGSRATSGAERGDVFEGQAQALEAQLAAARAEVAALRASKSWKITQPLRSLYEVLRAGKRGAFR